MCKRLNKAMERIWGCPHIDCCPVKFELLLPTARSWARGTDGDDGHAATSTQIGSPGARESKMRP